MGSVTYFVDNLPITTGNSTRLYIDGRDYCADLHSELGTAKEWVFLTGLHFMADFGLLRTGKASDATATLVEVLKSTAGRGVVVYLLVNQFWKDESEVVKGGSPIRKFIMKQGELFGYLPETLKLFQRLKGYKNIHCRTDIHPNHDTFGTHHQKTVVIDDNVAFLGGIDLTYGDGDRWDTPAHTAQYRHVDRTNKFWHDIHMRIEGPAVEFVRDNFVQRWLYGNLHSIKEGSNSLDDWNRHMEGEAPRLTVDATPDRNPPALPLFASKPGKKFRYFTTKPKTEFTYPTGKEDPSTATVQIVRSIPRRDKDKMPAWNTSKSDWDRSCQNAYLTGIASATKYIYLENQWVADEKIWKALAVAATRNKKNPDFRIIVMLPRDPLFAAGFGSNQELWIGTEMERVMNAGHSKGTFGVYSLVQYDRKENLRAQIYVHSKILIVDDQWSLIGSANAGGISLEGVRGGKDQPDTELSAIILDKQFASEFRSRLWTEHLEEPIKAKYDVKDADRFRAVAEKKGRRLIFFPKYKSSRLGLPTVIDSRTWEMLGLGEHGYIDTKVFTKQSRIIPSLSAQLLASGLPPTLIRAAFTAKVVPSPPPGYRCFYRWHIQLPYDPIGAFGEPRSKPLTLKLRSLRNDKDEVFRWSDKDSVYIGSESAKEINYAVDTAVLGIVRCRVKVLR